MLNFRRGEVLGQRLGHSGGGAIRHQCHPPDLLVVVADEAEMRGKARDVLASRKPSA